MENKIGDKTQPWGTPVFKIMFLDLKPFTTTCWDRSCRKSFIHRMSDGWTCRSRRRLQRVAGLTVLKAEEKSMNKIRVWECGESSCLQTVSRRVKQASSTPRFAL